MSTTGTLGPSFHALKALAYSPDGLRTCYAETSTWRRCLPHPTRGAACGYQRVRGADCGCGEAVMTAIADVVGYARRLAQDGKLDLDNPGGWFRHTLRIRCGDVIEKYAARMHGDPDAYLLTRRLADPANAPAYLPVEDELDRELLRAAVECNRKAHPPADWSALVEASHELLAYRGKAPGADAPQNVAGFGAELAVRLNRMVDAARAAGGPALTFVERELLAPLERRRTALLGEHDQHVTGSLPSPEQAHEAALLTADVIARIEEEMLDSTPWVELDPAAKAAAVRGYTDITSSKQLRELVELIDDVYLRAAIHPYG